MAEATLACAAGLLAAALAIGAGALTGWAADLADEGGALALVGGWAWAALGAGAARAGEEAGAAAFFTACLLGCCSGLLAAADGGPAGAAFGN